MNKQTIAALIAGAEKWERNALAKVPEDAQIYGDSCELCKMFCEKRGHCHGCPVMEATGERQCGGTPWDRAEESLCDWEAEAADVGAPSEIRNARARFRRAASAEAKFLRSLIPAEGATA